MADIERAKAAATSAMVALHCCGWSDINHDQKMIKDARVKLKEAIKALDTVVK